MSEKLLYTVEEAAVILGLPKSWLYSRARLSAVPHRKLGKYLRFSKSDLEAIISANEAAARNGDPTIRPAA
jgi:excisionase family DNA binding protein